MKLCANFLSFVVVRTIPAPLPEQEAFAENASLVGCDCDCDCDCGCGCGCETVHNGDHRTHNCPRCGEAIRTPECGVAAISGFSAVFLPEGCDAAVRLLKVGFVEGERRFVYVQDRAGQHQV